MRVLRGKAASSGVYTGSARLILSENDLLTVNEGDVLVTEMTDPKYTSVFFKVGAVVTEIGGMLCHAAIVARELGVPCVVGVKGALNEIANSDEVLVDANNGTVTIL